MLLYWETGLLFEKRILSLSIDLTCRKRKIFQTSKDYIEVIFHDERWQLKWNKNIETSEILKITSTLDKMNRNKIIKTRWDLNRDVVGLLDDLGIDIITVILNEIYDSGHIPEGVCTFILRIQVQMI